MLDDFQFPIIIPADHSYRSFLQILRADETRFEVLQFIQKINMAAFCPYVYRREAIEFFGQPVHYLNIFIKHISLPSRNPTWLTSSRHQTLR